MSLGSGTRAAAPLAVAPFTAVPYRLVVPKGWTRLPVDPVGMRAAVRAMLLRRFAQHPRDATAVLRREVEQELVSLTRGPGHEYMRMLLVLDLQVERRPVTGTCLVSLLPQRVAGEQALSDLAASMADGAAESVVADLGPNRGVVVVRDTVAPDADVPPDAPTSEAARRYAGFLETGSEAEPGPPAADRLPPDVLRAGRTTRSVDVFLPVPDSPRVLLLSFSTQVAPLFGPLTTLFLTIAGTVQWNRDGEAWS
ncbi:MAG: hypothetical protein WD794_06465 [Mycobacteriales bacterium]